MLDQIFSSGNLHSILGFSVLYTA